MATLKDVKAWRVVAGVGHVVANSKQGWEFWLCGMFTPGTPPYQKRTPKRKCVKCLKALAEATPIAQPNKAKHKEAV